jgi:hypothetical protein
MLEGLKLATSAADAVADLAWWLKQCGERSAANELNEHLESIERIINELFQVSTSP